MSSAIPSQILEDGEKIKSMAADLAMAIINSSNHTASVAQELQVEAATDLAMAVVGSSNLAMSIVREVLQAASATAVIPHSAKPIMVHYKDRVVAMGRQQLTTIGRLNVLQYLKDRLDVGNLGVSLYGTFVGNEGEFVEVDVNAWEEFVPQIVQLQLRVREIRMTEHVLVS
ncbi:hypothetical protein P691DRAFT_807596 [Macrolepiota fuliginosa MF-IS2]|uniref:Uncharacterized protein n=1 Tax=Macrolepiota fuliginosa MF-IS2 TaxID=1400762 RepID=A0A9P5XHI3_9AGAR|nr:hypothetical protein P691DRAFT_807596 [Macrolepiota fuliginosa MF-IS2]